MILLAVEASLRFSFIWFLVGPSVYDGGTKLTLFDTEN
jgi:hypothetical protein